MQEEHRETIALNVSRRFINRSLLPTVCHLPRHTATEVYPDNENDEVSQLCCMLIRNKYLRPHTSAIAVSRRILHAKKQIG